MRISDWSSDVCSSDLLVLQPLSKDEIIGILKRALKKLKRTKDVTPKALDYLAELSGGDARVALGNLELALGFDEKVTPDVRSEERRVGKEWVCQCRYRWPPYH